MKKIGLLFGMERVFPPALIARINELGGREVHAVEIKIGAIKMDDVIDYSVIFDRASSQIPFYRTYLKLAALSGVRIVNNPFVTSAENTLFHAATAKKLGIKVPKTVAIPSKEIPEAVTGDSLHNLIYPLDWDETFDYVGFPAYLKPNVSNGIRTAFKVYNKQEFFSAYEVTGRKSMILQESIEWERYYRCYVIGKKHVRILAYDPSKPQHMRHIPGEADISPIFKEKIEEICIKICKTLNYDFNAIEFALKDGEIWATSFFNLTPNADPYFLMEDNFNWLLDTTAKFLINLAKLPPKKHKLFNWSELMECQPSDNEAMKEAIVKKAPGKKAK